jgi:hypothetical protein
VLAAALWCCALPAALAGRPLQTEDAGILDRGDCELEAVLERAGSGPEQVRAQGLGLGCGLAPGLQAGVAVAAAKA